MNRVSIVLPLTAVALSAPVWAPPRACAQTESALADQARAALNAEKWSEADRLYTALIARAPRNAAHWVSRSYVRNKNGYYTSGAADGLRGETLYLLEGGSAREQVLALVNRADAFRRSGDPLRALVEAIAARTIDETYAWPWIICADTWYDLGNYEQAVACLERGQKRDSAFSRTYTREQAAQNGKRFAAFESKPDLTADLAIVNKALEEKRYADAVAAFTRMLEKNPSNSAVWESRANTYVALKDYSRAIQDYATAISLQRAFQEAEQQRRALVGRANAFWLAGRLEEAEDDCTLALRLKSDDARAKAVLALVQEAREPDDPRALLKRAIAALEQEKTAPNQFRALQTATKCLDRVLVLEPRNAEAWYWRGRAEEVDVLRMRIGSNEKALPYYDKAIELDPKYGAAYLQRGLVWAHLFTHKAADHQKAAADLDRAIALGIQEARAFGERGQLRSDRATAVQDFTEALKREPANEDYLRLRAMAYEETKNWRGAVADWTALAKVEKEAFAGTFARRGDDYALLQERDKAIADYTKAIALKPTRPEYVHRRGDLHYEQKHFELAWADYNTAVTLDPNDAVGYFRRGNASFMRSNYDDAIVDYTKALELRPNFAEAKSNREIAKTKKGNKTK